MDDEKVFELLRSSHPLVVIDAPAGCGKTYQAAKYAESVAAEIVRGKCLILTHTHAARTVFASRTRNFKKKIQISTIDSFILSIASIYFNALDLPKNVPSWIRDQGDNGYKKIASKVLILLQMKPNITTIISTWYPVVICDEHQDSSTQQHEIVMAIQKAGSMLRVFGDPQQIIYSSNNALVADIKRWNALKAEGKSAVLKFPHRWKEKNEPLGNWILKCRDTLKDGEKINLTNVNIPGLKILKADNCSKKSLGFQFDRDERKAFASEVKKFKELIILSSTNQTVRDVNAALFRNTPIWEGYTREPLSKLVKCLTENYGNPLLVASGVLDFLYEVSVGFSKSSHGDRLIEEVKSECKQKTKGKPRLIQDLARFLILEPNHSGVSKFLSKLNSYIFEKEKGFDGIFIDLKREFYEAQSLGRHENAYEGERVIQAKRAHRTLLPPAKCISTVHKAKGLECESIIIAACDSKHFKETDKDRNLLYVALSRATQNLTIVLSNNAPCPLFTFNDGGLVDKK